MVAGSGAIVEDAIDLVDATSSDHEWGNGSGGTLIPLIVRSPAQVAGSRSCTTPTQPSSNVQSLALLLTWESRLAAMPEV